MNTAQFIQAIKEINASTYSYGNEILYMMGKTPGDLLDPVKVDGAVWIIGRSYAASPQRRSYGKTKTGEKYNNFGGDTVIRPVWPVKTQNDGREGFFEFISKEIDMVCLKDLIREYHGKGLTYRFSPLAVKRKTDKNKTLISCEMDKNDQALLVRSIAAVLAFNQQLNAAIEKFDDVPASHEFRGECVACSNHISFASKFLHFYFPNLVFIIDSYAFSGGKALFNGGEKTVRYIRTPPTDTVCFEGDVYQQFPKDIVKKICTDVTAEVVKMLKTMLPADRADFSLKNANMMIDPDKTVEDNSDDPLNGNHYVEHCVRSYLLGEFLARNGVVPCSVITAEPCVKPMPRLTDAVFLNIKKPLTRKESDYQKSLSETFYSKV